MPRMKERKMKVENSVYRSSCNLFPYEAGEDLAEAMYKYLTEKQEDAVVQRRYEQFGRKMWLETSHNEVRGMMEEVDE